MHIPSEGNGLPAQYLLVGQTTREPKTSYQNISSDADDQDFWRRGEGANVAPASAGRHGNGDWVPATILGDGFLGGRISRLFVGRRMDRVANSVVAVLNE